MKHKFLKKKGQFFQLRKDFVLFSPSIDCDKPDMTICRRPKSLLTITVEVIRSYLQHLRCCWKHKFLKKRQPFQWRKKFGLFFLALSNMKFVSEHYSYITVHRDIWHLLWSFRKKNISLTFRRLLKTQIFESKARFPKKKKVWPIFSRLIECNKPQGTFYKGTNGIVTNTLEVTRSFL